MMPLLPALRKLFAKRPPTAAEPAAAEVLDAAGWQARRSALLARVGKARWDDPDPAVRRGRVEWVTQEILAVMVHTDPDRSVRLNACRWIMDRAVLAEIAQQDESPEVRDVATRYLTKLDAMAPDEIARIQERWETRRKRMRESSTR